MEYIEEKVLKSGIELTDKNKIIIDKYRQAIAVALDAHSMQTRREGSPYYTHVLNVAFKAYNDFDREDLFLIGLYHDTLEDTHLTVEDLEIYLTDDEIDSVIALTRKVGESRDDYYSRVRKNRDASIIKTIDRIHNLQSSWNTGDSSKSKRFRAWYLKNTKEDFKLLFSTTELKEELQKELSRIEQEQLERSD